MSQAAISAVSAVDLAVANLPAARDFFAEAWKLREIATADGIHYFRAAGPAFHTLSLRAGSEPALIRVILAAQSRAAVDASYKTIREAGLTADGAPRDLRTPGGGYGFGFKDLEGRNFAIVSDTARHAPITDAPDMPAKLSHVNLNCRDNDASFAVMRALGFKLSDQTRQFRFIRCNADHHSLVLGFNDNANLNHIAFEMPDLEAVMRGIGRMRDHGHGVEWGPGRHGPGNNVFAYFCGPEDLPLEYTGEMQQVADDFTPSRKPEQWTWPAGRLDHWGLTPGPSARVKAAQARFKFSETGFRLDG
ncbi:MAG: VOC family protein [Xanthobacteraceae bacterium]|uniref:VOC family protein n=1 Tax=Pseudolabrys sp. TaxID=1960880 RepID=UPI003D127520